MGLEWLKRPLVDRKLDPTRPTTSADLEPRRDPLQGAVDAVVRPEAQPLRLPLVFGKSPRPRCDGDHGGPPCADPECWAREDARPADVLRLDALLQRLDRFARDRDVESGLPVYDDGARALMREILRGWLAEQPAVPRPQPLLDDCPVPPEHRARKIRQQAGRIVALMHEVEDAKALRRTVAELRAQVATLTENVTTARQQAADPCAGTCQCSSEARP